MNSKPFLLKLSWDPYSSLILPPDIDLLGHATVLSNLSLRPAFQDVSQNSFLSFTTNKTSHFHS
jgi:hypothetical protein